VRYITANRQIYGEGEDASAFFKVVSGVVRVCTFLSDGRRQIDAFHPSGDIFGLEAGKAYNLSAEAVCASTLISYRRSDLARFAANNEALSRQLLFYAMRGLARAPAHSVMLGRKTAVEKVAAFIIDWAAYSPNSNVVTLAMSRQDIADYLGLTIETVSRTFSHLEREAFIEVTTARQITLKDRRGLRDLNS
jgi:CRP/FNR family nitrogen fixation transcriptional regulator